MLKVRTLKTNAGNESKNQLVVETNGKIHFVSYDTNIAVYDIEKKELKVNHDYYDYSRTTKKYYNQFIRKFLPGKFETNYISDFEFEKAVN